MAGGLLVLALGALYFWRGEGMQDGTMPENLEQIARGKILYNENCASCHGGNLEGEPNWRQRKPNGRLPAPPHDDTGHTWHHADGQLFWITKHGVKPPLAPEGYESDMPAFGEILSEEDIWAVLSFIKSTWSEKSRAYQDRITQAYSKNTEEK